MQEVQILCFIYKGFKDFRMLYNPFYVLLSCNTVSVDYTLAAYNLFLLHNIHPEALILSST